MVRPAHFGYNVQTAVNNVFQTDITMDNDRLRTVAQQEFDTLVEALIQHGVQVDVWNDNPDVIKPDAVFPNNWFSTTPEGVLITYPLFAPNRRTERDENLIAHIERNYRIVKRYSFEQYEDQHLYLEGTGSMLFDHARRIIYACISPRTDLELLNKISVLLDYEVHHFYATDPNGQAIYHTNVMMCLGHQMVIVCLESIRKPDEKQKLIERYESQALTIVDISMQQVYAFAGNMLQLKSHSGEWLLVMSEQARKSLNPAQIKTLERYSTIVSADISFIENVGGGSARCMIAEMMPDAK